MGNHLIYTLWLRIFKISLRIVWMYMKRTSGSYLSCAWAAWPCPPRWVRWSRRRTRTSPSRTTRTVAATGRSRQEFQIFVDASTPGLQIHPLWEIRNPGPDSLRTTRIRPHIICLSLSFNAEVNMIDILILNTYRKKRPILPGFKRDFESGFSVWIRALPNMDPDPILS